MTFLLNHPRLLFLTVAIVLFASSLVGYRLALTTHINDDSHHHEQINSLREGLFILLGLLLGFTVAMVLPRFDERRQLVIDEANAIGTTMLRAEMLPEPERSKSLELLRQYAVVRRDSATGPEQSLQPTKALQAQLWQQIVSVTQQSQTAVIAAYIQTLNETIDVSEKRLAAFENRVPKSVWMIIIIVAIFQGFAGGFSLKRKLWFSLVTAPLVIAVVMALIADLDSPHTGLIHVEQYSMDRLVKDVAGTKQ
ncbi:MAG: hypothetical protein WB711_17220 [Terriglobales bacterium]